MCCGYLQPSYRQPLYDRSRAICNNIKNTARQQFLWALLVLCDCIRDGRYCMLDPLWLFIDLAFWEAMRSQNGHSYLPMSSENAAAGLLSKSGNISQWNAKEPKALWNEVRYYILSEKHADKEKFCRESLKNLGLLVSRWWYSSLSRQSVVVGFISFYPEMLFF